MAPKGTVPLNTLATVLPEEGSGEFISVVITGACSQTNGERLRIVFIASTPHGSVETERVVTLLELFCANVTQYANQITNKNHLSVAVCSNASQPKCELEFSASSC